MISGRPRAIPAAKCQTKVSTANMKKDYKPMRKATMTKASKEATSDSTIETITQRTRNLRKSLHKIQKQFGNQAITKFFQRTLKAAHSHPQFGGDNDENACDAFSIEQLNHLGENNNECMNDDEQNTAQNGSTTLAYERENGVKLENIDELRNDDLIDVEHIAQITDSQNSIQPSNIFLQKPVLHLNIDKSLVQASSIVINKQLDVCPNFATSFYSFNNSLNTANKEFQNKSSEDESSIEHNDVQSPNASKPKGEKTKPRLRKRRPRKCASKWADNNALGDAIVDSDSNSCDSGVVSDRSFELSSTDGNKPTTPHRIVCPSNSMPTDEQNPQKTDLIRKIAQRNVKQARGKQPQNR